MSSPLRSSERHQTRLAEHKAQRELRIRNHADELPTHQASVLDQIDDLLSSRCQVALSAPSAEASEHTLAGMLPSADGGTLSPPRPCAGPPLKGDAQPERPVLRWEAIESLPGEYSPWFHKVMALRSKTGECKGYVPISCGDRLCECHNYSEALERIALEDAVWHEIRAGKIRGLTGLTLTMRSFPDGRLRYMVQEFNKALRRFTRTKWFRSHVRAWFAAFETTCNRTRPSIRWHHHVNLVLECDFLPKHELTARWSQACGERGFITWVQRFVLNPKDVHKSVEEAVKYSVKRNEARSLWRREWRAEYRTALRRVPLYRWGGSWRGMRSELRREQNRAQLLKFQKQTTLLVRWAARSGCPCCHGKHDWIQVGIMDELEARLAGYKSWDLDEDQGGDRRGDH